MADMNFGILASNSSLLTDIADKLHENTQKLSTVDRLSKNLQPGIPKTATKNYLLYVKTLCPLHPVIQIDDSDVVKPDGYKFESLGYVRDSSESTETKNVFKKLEF